MNYDYDQSEMQECEGPEDQKSNGPCLEEEKVQIIKWKSQQKSKSHKINRTNYNELYQEVEQQLRLLKTICQKSHCFSSLRDTLEREIQYLRFMLNNYRLSYDDSRKLGFITHIRNSLNYTAHKDNPDIIKDDVFFILYYATKHFKILKHQNWYNYELQTKIIQALEVLSQILKDEDDIEEYRRMVNSCKDPSKLPDLIFKRQGVYFEGWKQWRQEREEFIPQSSTAGKHQKKQQKAPKQIWRVGQRSDQFQASSSTRNGFINETLLMTPYHF
ncbi:hypothetical protein FGO68_gene11742 [Halteria grandinella]|uniref:Uncharacterized protein n=1 Tax=Halteria grandinella TaxID=5974 RepID=A0A8J8NMD9_HALGN|nr:hypothetical protein FGO68_gene11742 [Halteria grandinella]